MWPPERLEMRRKVWPPCQAARSEKRLDQEKFSQQCFETILSNKKSDEQKEDDLVRRIFGGGAGKERWPQL